MVSDQQPPSGKNEGPSRFERRILWLALLAGAPGVIAAIILLWAGGFSTRTQWTFSILLVCAWLAVVLTLHERVTRPLQTVANMLAALREGDFSIRGRGARSDDALGLVLLEVNTLGDTLRSQRMEALEAIALLRTVMEEIDVAIFAFD
jgi:methyl-accepting chemotaxis protein